MISKPHSLKALMTLPPLPDALLDTLLADDVPFLDLTTHILGLGAAPGRMTFAARGAMILGCSEDGARIIERCGAKVTLHKGSGEALAAGDTILIASGPAAALLRAWKIAQNLIETASGIATATRAIVLAAQKAAPDISIACTRKNSPGTKLISTKAILAGGALPHRSGLSETILIFAEHRAFLAGRSESEILSLARRGAAEKKIVVEVGGLDEALAWGKAGADVIQAEKFPPERIAELARALGPRGTRALIAAAGGVNAGNAPSYAAAGADILVTSAPYWAKPSDVAVTIETAT
jgi:molybdenum transport protein